MNRYAYAEMPSVRFFCGNAHRHLIMRKYRQMYIKIDSGYPHDGRAGKNPYPHDPRADKDSNPHDSNNQCIILRLQLSFVMINEQMMLV